LSGIDVSGSGMGGMTVEENRGKNGYKMPLF